MRWTLDLDLRFLCRTRPSTAIARWVVDLGKSIKFVPTIHGTRGQDRYCIQLIVTSSHQPTSSRMRLAIFRRLWSTRTLCGGMYGWAVVDDRLDLIPSHPPIGRIIPLRWVLGWRSRTRPWTRTPSMWCHAWRIGYHDQDVRTSTAMPPPTMAPRSPSRTASYDLCERPP